MNSLLKITNLVVFVGAVPATFAGGIKGEGVTTYFVPGVNFESGWHDANKNRNGDDQLCWAAQSACMAQYWQDWYVKAGGVLGNAPDGYTVREDGFKESDIFSAFKENWSNKGGLSEFGLAWYFSGDLPYNYAINIQNNPNGFSRVAENTGGYFSDLYENNTTFVRETSFARHFYDGNGLQLSEFTEDLLRLVCEEHCVVGLSLEFWGNYENGTTAGSYGGHAVTLWGFDVDDESGLISAIHITDSDDEEYALKTYSVTDGRLGWDVEFPDYLREGVRDKYWTLTDQFFTLSVKEFTATIPEPSAFGLLAGLAALAFAGARRRRFKS